MEEDIGTTIICDRPANVKLAYEHNSITTSKLKKLDKIRIKDKKTGFFSSDQDYQVDLECNIESEHGPAGRSYQKDKQQDSEREDIASTHSLSFTNEDDIPCMSLPLDVQISEGEETQSFGNDEVEELPVKGELLLDESTGGVADRESVQDDVTSHCDSVTLKVEPLEESYEDRINFFLQALTAQNSGEEKNTSEVEDEKEHFVNGVNHLLQKKQKRERKKSLTCKNCSAIFRYQSTYNYHVKSQCGTKMILETDKLVKAGKDQAFVCNVCHKVMCSRTSLMVHMRIHNGERPFVCNVCSRAFVQKAHLKDHMKIHTPGKPKKPLMFTCTECGQVFSENKFLLSHMQLHFGDKVFSCNVCHKRFRTRSNLSSHKMIHSDKKDFKCSICGKAFLRRPNLDEHMRTHTNEKPFTCEICGKLFAEKSRKNVHVKRHTGELKQECAFCKKKFACSYDLRVHLRMHTGEKPFSCNICGRTFNRKITMETHMTIHTGRKDFVCTQCGEAFNRKSKLDVHMTSHTGEEFCCEICHKSFRCKAYLVPHVRTHLTGTHSASSPSTRSKSTQRS